MLELNVTILRQNLHVAYSLLITAANALSIKMLWSSFFSLYFILLQIRKPMCTEVKQHCSRSHKLKRVPTDISDLTCPQINSQTLPRNISHPLSSPSEKIIYSVIQLLQPKLSSPSLTLLTVHMQIFWKILIGDSSHHISCFVLVFSIVS